MCLHILNNTPEGLKNWHMWPTFTKLKKHQSLKIEVLMITKSNFQL